MPTGAGSLYERITFEKRAVVVDDGYGNKTGDFVPQFTVSAKVQPLKGREDVIGRRLEGVQPVIITVRSSSQTRQITPDWQARDARTGRVYQITAVADMEMRRAFIDIMATYGVAA